MGNKGIGKEGLRLIACDIDGVLRDIYTPLYEMYKTKNRNVPKEKFMKEIVLIDSPMNRLIMGGLLHDIGVKLYSNSRPNIELINFLTEKNKEGVDIRLATTYINKEQKKATLGWVARYIPFKVETEFFMLGKKEIKDSEQYDKIYIIDDAPFCWDKSKINKDNIVFIEYNMLFDDINKIKQIIE